MAGRERFCISSMDECNTVSHTRSIGLRDDLPGGKGGTWVVLATSDPRLPWSTFYQPAMRGATASKTKNFEGLPLSSYILEIWRKIFQVLEAEAQQNPMLLPEDIKRAKGEGVKAKKRFIPLIKVYPEGLSV